MKIVRGIIENQEISSKHAKYISNIIGSSSLSSLSSAFSALRKFHELENILKDSIGLYEVRRVRDEKVKYGVGDVVSHKLFGNGVITSWDETCGAHYQWIESNNIRTFLFLFSLRYSDKKHT